MTRQPINTDAFLPSGALDDDALLQPSSPTSASKANPSATYDLQPICDYHTRNSHAAAAPRFAPSAPHFNYASSHMPLAESLDSSIRRDSSLSPTNIGLARAPRPPMLPSPPAGSLRRDTVSPSLAVAASLSRSASADAAAPQQTSLHLVQRLAQQNSLIRDAWEAERRYLEANRKRAEEVYQEERTIMDGMRDSWFAEKAALQRELHTLHDRLHHLERENTRLKSLTSPCSQRSGLVSPAPGAKLHADSLPPGLQGASQRPHFLSSNGSRTSPTANPEQPVPVPLDPRTQPETSSSRDFLASRKKPSDVPIPLIDVHEIDPKLDGIFIKANAVRDTFTQSSVKSSPATSPPTDQSSLEREGAPYRRSSSKAQTMQALAAGEMRRRTMHAGHTPNHSLSLFPTMTTLDGTMTAGQSEATTPTAVNGVIKEDGQGSEAAAPVPETRPAELVPEVETLKDIITDDQEPHFEPQDDAPLKGPLMVKNIPAQDEIFWARVNQKLEGISHSEEEALPTVIKSQLAEVEKPTADDAAPETLEASKPVEVDVPLKIRTTTNFGAPFGVA
ncbi:hypothetical protein V2A60_002160 [Cordyceps javanica]|uniref:Uncharacterized protein n=1 Tax=Cordyceps javanica TaxID=43265 RepID=A0A545WEA2_9HYPO|nr:hypothetical protein IF1G_01082 [Cordyceps javanica]TQW12310.1 hypothetical protein IF2G_01041 [Cordyceps javanica]